MSQQHQTLTADRWNKFSLYEQMANIGSEVERAINWGKKGVPEYSRLAFVRSIELIDLSLNDTKHRGHFKELTRLKEFWADYFMGKNQYKFSAESWQKYFLAFNFAARKNS
ncbi:MAG: hypothetical protein ABIH50_01985 [bacterium]